MSARKCRVCGCTDNDCRQCIERVGEPCTWVEVDLCSACTGLTMICLERIRQSKLGFNAEHDAAHLQGEIAQAAACYALAAAFQVRFPGKANFTRVPATWPFEPRWWKPSPDPKRNLAKAGALMAAEIDRLTDGRFIVP